MAPTRDVFINCPFDDDYRPLFNAIVFAVLRSGFRVRSALEADDAAQSRFVKIAAIIAECRYGIHDISRTEVDGDPPLPRFNMPLELGLFLGARRYGGEAHASKQCIIFDRERFRYQRFISDIAGQDIHSHDGKPRTLIRELAAWLRRHSNRRTIPGGEMIADEYEVFVKELPDICATRRLAVHELTFGDLTGIAAEYITMRQRVERGAK